MAVPKLDFSQKINTAIDLCKNFMVTQEWGHAFETLDKLCEFAIEYPGLAESINLGASHDQMLSQVARVDSLCEKFHARKFIQAPVTGSVTPLSDYPWFLRDYYTDEYRFIKEHTGDTSIDHAVHIGHGAIPSLALVLLEQEPDIQLSMVDHDAEASDLARKVTQKITPLANMSFSTSDVRTCFAPSADITPPRLIIVTNAPLAMMAERRESFDCEYLFIRSATPAGKLLYPRMDTDMLQGIGFELLEQRKDKRYGIHEWIMAGKAAPSGPR